MLQRIYGTAFASEKDLEKYINRMESPYLHPGY